MQDKTKIHIFKGKSFSGKTTEIINNLLEKNSEDPLSYIFIGPNGNYVKNIREKCMSETESIISSNFFTIDQFAVTLYKEANPDLLFIQKELILFEISRILSHTELKGISKSSNILEFLYKMINDVKENNGFENIFSDYEDSYISFLKKIFDTVQSKIENNKTFDTFDAYLKLSDCVDSVDFSKYGKTLFIDGFNDFSKAHQIFITTISDKFSEVYLSFPVDTDKEKLFYGSQSFINIFNSLNKKTTASKITGLNKQFFPDELSSFKTSLFSGNLNFQKSENIVVSEFKNKNDEICETSRIVKSMLVKGIPADDISVVVPDDDLYIKSLEEKLEEYSVNYSTINENNIENSIIVKKILASFECLHQGFSTNSFMALFDSGYSKNPENARIYEKLALDAHIYYDYEFNSLENKKSDFKRKLSIHKKFLEKKLRSMEYNYDEEFGTEEIDQIKKDVEFIEKFKKDIDDIFSILENINTGKININEYFSLMEKLFKEIQKNEEFEEIFNFRTTKIEKDYVNLFFEKLLPDLEKALFHLGYDKISPDLFYEYLKIFIHSKKYYISPPVSGRITIENTTHSRFNRKKFKFFIGFTDENYPKISINPFYSYLMYESDVPKDFFNRFEDQEKLNLYLSIINAEKKIFFSYPIQTNDGKPILKSIYIDEFEKFSVSEKTEYSNKNKKFVFCRKELENKLTKFFDSKIWDELRDSYDLNELENSLNKEKNEFEWKIKDLNSLKKNINNNYSFSKLNSYDQCPFKFFLIYLIGLKGEEKSTYELNPLEEGILYHNVLRDFYSGEDYKKSIEQNLNKLIDTSYKDIYDYEYIKHEKILNNYIFNKETKKIPNRSSSFIPEYFELPFGPKYNKLVKISKINLNGKIDRIDEDQNKLYLIDYKRSPNGDKKQLILYSLAVEILFPEKELTGGVFKPVKTEKNYFDNFKIQKDEDRIIWKFSRKEISKEEILNWIDNTHESISEGIYPPSFINNSKACFNCPFKNISYLMKWRNDY